MGDGRWAMGTHGAWLMAHGWSDRVELGTLGDLVGRGRTRTAGVGAGELRRALGVGGLPALSAFVPLCLCASQLHTPVFGRGGETVDERLGELKLGDRLVLGVAACQRVREAPRVQVIRRKLAVPPAELRAAALLAELQRRFVASVRHNLSQFTSLEVASTRSAAARQYCSSHSMPIACRPSCLAATRVVPTPM